MLRIGVIERRITAFGLIRPTLAGFPLARLRERVARSAGRGLRIPFALSLSKGNGMRRLVVSAANPNGSVLQTNPLLPYGHPLPSMGEGKMSGHGAPCPYGGRPRTVAPTKTIPLPRIRSMNEKGRFSKRPYGKIRENPTISARAASSPSPLPRRQRQPTATPASATLSGRAQARKRWQTRRV